MKKLVLTHLVLILLLAACESLPTPISAARQTTVTAARSTLAAPIPASSQPSLTPAAAAFPTPETLPVTGTATAKPTPVQTSTPTQKPGGASFIQAPPVQDEWQRRPIVPEISSAASAIYRRGLALGNNPNAFSKVGDCNSLSVRYLTYFDGLPSTYNLETYTYLQPLLAVFKDSFARQSVAVGDGFNTSAILATFRADPLVCKPGESPLVCEYRIHKPSFALIAIGTDDYLAVDKFEANLRSILQTTIERGIVPILATKVDNANQLDYNPIIARLADEYDIPLWNLWLATQPLPNAGQADNIHPGGEFAAFDFSADNLSRYGWPVRNLTALQALNAAWKAVTAP